MANKGMFGVLLSALAIALRITAQQNGRGPNCDVPLNVPGVNIDPLQIMGTWYEYMYRTPGLDDINNINIFTPLGWVQDPVAGTWAVAVNWTVIVNIVRPEGTPCMGLFAQSNFTKTGLKNGLTYLPGATTPERTRYAIFFTDYNLLEIHHRCEHANLQTGMCDEPLFFINTRVMPAQLTPAQRQYVVTQVDRALAPYCFRASDLNFTAQNPSLPPCNPTPPAGFANLVNSFRTLPLNQGPTWGRGNKG